MWEVDSLNFIPKVAKSQSLGPQTWLKNNIFHHNFVSAAFSFLKIYVVATSRPTGSQI